MDLNIDHPIAALASPPGGARRGIVRISGHGIRDLLSGWFEPDNEQLWHSTRTATCHAGHLKLDKSHEPVRCRVEVLYWPNQRSYTGQPLVELHLPGAPALLEVVLGEVYRRGARVARPGEFTLRAFLAGKLDLFQAEAVLGVIDARDHQELQTALTQLAGGVSGRLTHLRRDLIELLADLEAGLDFVDEDIEFVGRHEVIHRLSAARDFVEDVLRQSNQRMQSNVRFKVVLAGLPNAGKSTLFNRLIGRESALVSPVEGTTRDYLVQRAEFDGLTFDLIDTAGWEQVSTGIAGSAQDQRWNQVQKSDLLIWCTPENLSNAARPTDDSLFNATRTQSRATIRVMTKSDLGRDFPIGEGLLRVSAVTDTGLDQLKSAISNCLKDEKQGAGQWLGMTAARCRETLESIAASLSHALATAQSGTAGDELIAVDLREALDHLGMILGVIYTDDILDRIFSKFCIGK